MMKKHLQPCLLFSIACMTFTSCIGDEPANAECDIESAWIPISNSKDIFFQGKDSIIVASNESDIVFETDGYSIQEVPLCFTITKGATIFYISNTGAERAFNNGELIDLSDEKINKFRVHSEDKRYTREYTVKCILHKRLPKPLVFNFDEGFELTTIRKDDPYPFYTWTDYHDFVPTNLWSTGNAGYRMTGLKAQPDDYPSCPEMGTGIDGSNCVKLTTRDTGSLGAMVNMRIAAGNLYFGTFNVENALTETLKSTLFGVPYAHKPHLLTGFYKFKPGAKMQDRNGNELIGEIDYPDIYCVVYSNKDEQDKPFQLDGSNILSSPSIVGLGRINGEDIDRTGSTWKPFEIAINYNVPIKSDDVDKEMYSVAIVFSSSIRGADFIGAPGSTLWIDNVKLECEY